MVTRISCFPLILLQAVLQLIVGTAASNSLCYTKNQLDIFTMKIERVGCGSSFTPYIQFPTEEDVSLSKLIPLHCPTDELPTVSGGNFDCKAGFFSDECHLKCNNGTFFPPSLVPTINCERNANYEFEWEDGIFKCVDCGSWVEWGQSLYLLVKKEQTWDVAAITCEIDYKGAHLVAVEDQFENDFIKHMINACEGETFSWIALNDKEIEGQWEGIDRTASFYNWGYRIQKEPNGGSKENCAVVSSKTGQWHDVRCNWHYKFICERDMPQPSQL